MLRKINQDGGPENQNQCNPKIFSGLIAELPGKNIPQYNEYQADVDDKPQQAYRNQVIEVT
jgi:hypothetical protein